MKKDCKKNPQEVSKQLYFKDDKRYYNNEKCDIIKSIQYICNISEDLICNNCLMYPRDQQLMKSITDEE